MEALTKGIEMTLPSPHFFIDKHKIRRTRVRASWWDSEATTYRQIAKMTDQERLSLPELDVPSNARIPVPTDKPIFFGHYWMKGEPAPLSAAAACVDFSAGEDGPLVAYRWDGPGPLSAQSFVASD